MFIDLRTNNDATNGNHLQSTSNDADYDQLLGQAEHGLIPLRSSLLRNPWFLKEVTARLQRNEDEASSDDESFVSITEVPFADPSMAETHKAHKPDSDPSEERNTFEVCNNVDQVNDTFKTVKSKFAFRVTRKPDGSIKYRCCLVACGYSQDELSLPPCTYLCCWYQKRRSTEPASEFR
jgi:hypothetical protein